MFFSRLRSLLPFGAASVQSSSPAHDADTSLTCGRIAEPANRARPSETTPKAITGQVRSFCAAVSPGAEPEYLAVQPTPWALPLHCFDNAARLAHEEGGRLVPGWTIWLFPGLYIEAQHHAVYEDAGNRLRDPTPQPDGEKRTLFLRDETATFNHWTRQSRPNVRHALVKHPAVLEFLASAAELDALMRRGARKRKRAVPAAELLRVVTRAAKAGVAFQACAKKLRR